MMSCLYFLLGAAIVWITQMIINPKLKYQHPPAGKIEEMQGGADNIPAKLQAQLDNLLAYDGTERGQKDINNE